MAILLGLVGLVVGAMAGAAVGVALGFAWITVFRTSGFEGYSGMLVFFTFMPLGAIVGALVGLVLGLILAARRPSPPAGNVQ